VIGASILSMKSVIGIRPDLAKDFPWYYHTHGVANFRKKIKPRKKNNIISALWQFAGAARLGLSLLLLFSRYRSSIARFCEGLILQISLSLSVLLRDPVFLQILCRYR
jgi:hypothetical protein